MLPAEGTYDYIFTVVSGMPADFLWLIIVVMPPATVNDAFARTAWPVNCVPSWK